MLNIAPALAVLTGAIMDFEKWEAGLEQATRSPNSYYEFVKYFLRRRGEWTTGTSHTGRDVNMLFYRDVFITVRYFEETEEGLLDSTLVAYPRFDDPVLSLYRMSSDHEMALGAYLPGPWEDYMRRIKDIKRARWNDIDPFEPSEPSHQELADELRAIAETLVDSVGKPITSGLTRVRLDRCRIDVQHDGAGTSHTIYVVNESGGLGAAYKRDGSATWQCAEMNPDMWLNDVYAAFETLGRIPVYLS